MDRRRFLKTAAGIGVSTPFKLDQASGCTVDIRYVDEPGERFGVDYDWVNCLIKMHANRRWTVELSMWVKHVGENDWSGERRLVPSERLRDELAEQGLKTKLETEGLQ